MLKPYLEKRTGLVGNLKKLNLMKETIVRNMTTTKVRPEQIARRSSRNQARRIMGDRTKIGMDVGHKDNDPLNNIQKI